nr:Ig-like domain-containing protein [Eubacterium sp.]
VKFTSSKKSVVSVDSKGNIYGAGKGSSVITVTSKKNKKVKATVKVTVTIGGLKSFEFPNEEYTWYVDEDDEYASWDPTEDYEQENPFAPDSSPYGYNMKYFKWSSSDEDVVVVDEDGVVSAVGEGTATVTCVYGKYKTSVKVTVTYEKNPDIDDEDGDEDGDYDDEDGDDDDDDNWDEDDDDEDDEDDEDDDDDDDWDDDDDE